MASLGSWAAEQSGDHLSLSTRRFGTPCSQLGGFPTGKPLNPKPEGRGPVIRGSTIGRLLPNVNWVHALKRGTSCPLRPACFLLRAKGTWRREPHLYGQLSGLCSRGGALHTPSVLGHGAVVGAATVACTLLLDVVVAAALRIVPGLILGPGILSLAFVIALLTRRVLPFSVLLKERLEDRLVGLPRLLAFPGPLSRSLANCLPLSPLSQVR